MPFTVSDNLLAEAGPTAEQARVDTACLLFDAGRLTLPAAVKWAGSTRSEFEEELLSRSIPIFRPQADELEDELALLGKVR